ncbi:hypothetical protein [Actinocrispum sp. NPDC049592]|uniref:hypothetical protein n=1 Tax=Actinocrispum sp. NPDC049592 TaxID=3154835 RepID=UPI003442873A
MSKWWQVGPFITIEYEVESGLLIAVTLVMLSLMLLLFADRANLKREAVRYRRLLTRYCDFVATPPRPTVRVQSWDQTLVLQENGDATCTIAITAVVLKKELYFLQLRFGSGWEQPERQRKRVRLTIRNLLIAGTRGTSWEITTTWLSASRLDVLAHFHEPVRQGSELRFEVEWSWPGQCVPLMRERRPDEYIFKFSKLWPLERATYAVILPAGLDAYHEPVGFAEPNGDFSIDASDDGDRRKFSFTGCNFPPRKRIGMRLELK